MEWIDFSWVEFSLKGLGGALKAILDNPAETFRLPTRVVWVGKVAVGGDNPIRVQSMTTADTNDIGKSVNEVKSLHDCGAEIVRLTVPNLNAVTSMEKIKNSLIRDGYDVPIVADVHFTPNAALKAAEFVEKVRINPGNFIDKKRFDEKPLTEEEYRSRLMEIEEKFVPLVQVCKKNQTAIRIGVNHGSLSDRIVARYGDTPLGMVKSAFEFLDIAEKNGFEDVIFSMKSSNPVVMTHSYRLLAIEMLKRGQCYPLHIGVTEAGDQEQGRVKSATGIGGLLIDGIGDTIRVSLTEQSENEIPVAKKIVALSKIVSYHFSKQSIIEGKPLNASRDYEQDYLSKGNTKGILEEKTETVGETIINYLSRLGIEYNKRETEKTAHFGEHYVPKIIVSAKKPFLKNSDLSQIGYKYLPKIDKWHTDAIAADGIIARSSNRIDFPSTLLVYEDVLSDSSEQKVNENSSMVADTVANDSGSREKLLFFDAREKTLQQVCDLLIKNGALGEADTQKNNNDDLKEPALKNTALKNTALKNTALKNTAFLRETENGANTKLQDVASGPPSSKKNIEVLLLLGIDQLDRFLEEKDFLKIIDPTGSTAVATGKPANHSRIVLCLDVLSQRGLDLAMMGSLIGVGEKGSRAKRLQSTSTSNIGEFALADGVGDEQKSLHSVKSLHSINGTQSASPTKDTSSNRKKQTANALQGQSKRLQSSPPLAMPRNALRDIFAKLSNQNLKKNVILYLDSEELTKSPKYPKSHTGGIALDHEGKMILSTLLLAPMFVDGLSDGIILENVDLDDIDIAFLILMSSRRRIAKPEYISCPSCGRTLFNLQKVTAKIKARTEHLKGVKIGIMGCIVNGPGEMADADFGYVGSGVGKITLYKGKQIVKRNIDEKLAVEALVDLIKENGMWREK